MKPLRNGRRVAVSAALIAAMTASSALHAQSLPRLGANPQQMLYIALNVNDFDKSRDFYVNILGLKENPGSAPTGAKVQSSSLSYSGGFQDTFLMISHERGKPPLPKGGGLARLTFKVADARAVVERARKSGYRILREPAAAHGMAGLVVGVVEDPDGTPVELVQTGG